MASGHKLWGGRFTGETDPLMTAYNESIHYDKRMFNADIDGSKAYAKALKQRGILVDEELEAILTGLETVRDEWKQGKFVLQPSDEDIHTANERRLGEVIGTGIAGKLHTGRSRNDQVATDMRLWLREEMKDVKKILINLLQVFAARAEKEIDIVMPGYTHLQRAQPIRWSHFLLSHALPITTDLVRLTEVYTRVNQLPLGAGALAGNPFAVDREFLRKELGFDGIIMNSMNAVADRDFVIEFMFWSSMVMSHISRIAEDLIIYSTSEFSFVTLSDAYATGSSIMPQKKNPDSLELLRGKSGRAFGNMAGFMMSVKGIPSTYNKDLQEDKEPLFDSLKTVKDSIQILTGVLSTLTVHPDKIAKSLTADLLATDLAEYLVRKGVPFRQTHHISGSAVRMAEERGTTIDQLSVEDFKSLHPLYEDDVAAVFDYEASVEKRCAIGGTAKSCVVDQIKNIRNIIARYKD
ncbi:argininosuccinate lyase [Schizosaccharomyces japonicus yFS275]|uniref:argininosuccinate lyase n=1 Tax=Schizosaccharomyces japonicus (strain yFS275 / FY16936) TaxID=402676 RepID=B6JY01_SCHJY|nr:argininosuccinate lyase [Schizosaccharomyces japonicus yFS275]EEB06419.1 argininosuccinate lyase [Schizosaccharomyces japonicus yFS275]